MSPEEPTASRRHHALVCKERGWGTVSYRPSRRSTRLAESHRIRSTPSEGPPQTTPIRSPQPAGDTHVAGKPRQPTTGPIRSCTRGFPQTQKGRLLIGPGIDARVTRGHGVLGRDLGAMRDRLPADATLAGARVSSAAGSVLEDDWRDGGQTRGNDAREFGRGGEGRELRW